MRFWIPHESPWGAECNCFHLEVPREGYGVAPFLFSALVAWGLTVYKGLSIRGKVKLGVLLSVSAQQLFFLGQAVSYSFSRARYGIPFQIT